MKRKKREEHSQACAGISIRVDGSFKVSVTKILKRLSEQVPSATAPPRALPLKPRHVDRLIGTLLSRAITTIFQIKHIRVSMRDACHRAENRPRSRPKDTYAVSSELPSAATPPPQTLQLEHCCVNRLIRALLPRAIQGIRNQSNSLGRVTYLVKIRGPKSLPRGRRIHTTHARAYYGLREP